MAGLVPDTNPAMEVPATFINQFQVLVALPVVRIAFAEGFAGQASNFRVAVTMSAEDARALAETILKNLPPEPVSSGNALAGLMKSAPERRYGR